MLQPGLRDEPPDPTVSGHPALEAVNAAGRTMRITVCAECGALKSILFLSGDRWYCVKCRNSGAARPTQIPVSRPGRH